MPNSQPKTASRRGFFLFASAAGAAVASASLLTTETPVAAVAELPKPAPENGGGYALSAHVKQYYKTARV